MKLKEKLNQAAGFTLVELIVVIAILAILAGIAVPAYSGYITQANKSNDQQLVAQIEQALTLAYYNGDLTEGGYVILSTDNAPLTSGEAITAALQAAFGSSLSGLKLNYSGWSTSLYNMDSDTANRIVNSSFLTGSNATELSGTMSSLTNAIAGVIDEKEDALGSILGALYDSSDTATDGALADLAADSFGVTDLTELNANQMSNLLLMSAADGVSNCTEDDVQTLLGDVINGTSNSELNNLTKLVLLYSWMSGYANSGHAKPGDKEKYETLTENLSNISGAGATGQAMVELDTFIGDLRTNSGSELNAYLTATESGGFASDSSAFLTMMGELSSGSSNLTAKDLEDENLATTGVLGEHLQSYVASAQAVASGVDLSALSTAMSEGDVGIVFYLKDGQFTVYSTIQS